MREGFIETSRVATERADINIFPDTTRHCPCCTTRLCTDYSSATCITIAPTVSWKKLVPISAGGARPLCRGGCWFGETVHGVFSVFWLFLSTAWVLVRILAHLLGGCLTVTTVKGLQNLTWLFLSPLFLIKLPSLGKLLALPSLTHNLQKGLSYEVKGRGEASRLEQEPCNLFHELRQLCTHHCARRAMMSERIRLRWKMEDSDLRAVAQTLADGLFKRQTNWLGSWHRVVLTSVIKSSK